MRIKNVASKNSLDWYRITFQGYHAVYYYLEGRAHCEWNQWERKKFKIKDNEFTLNL